MIGIIFATLQEAEPFLAEMGAMQIYERPFRTYRLGGTDIDTDIPKSMVILSGIGKVASALAAAHLMSTHNIFDIIT